MGAPEGHLLSRQGPLRAVDLFAGAGGFSTGAIQAGIEVVWAANHWPLAVRYHELNHPGANHACQDLHQANWLELPPHEFLLASPCCQGHSPARGKDRPHHDEQRSTAWAVVSCAEVHREDVLIIENVPAFLKWSLYPAWELAMKTLGYTLSPHIIDAADHGVPQNRERLFLVGTKSKNPIQLDLPKRDHVAIDTVIDWDYPDWTPIDKPGRSQKTLDRIANGRARYGDRFLAPFYGSGSGTTGRSIHRPVGTITTRDRWAIIDGNRMRMMKKQEVRASMGFPESYMLPETHREAVHLMGNAVCPPVVTDLIDAVLTAA